MPKHEIVAGVDIGSKFMQCVIAEIAEDSSIEILGFGTAPSKGIKKGLIINIQDAAQSIEEAVAEAEKTAGFEINSIYAGLGGEFLQTVLKRGEVTIASPDRIITENDVRRVVDAARLLGMTTEREIIHVLPRGFVVDGISGVKNAVGMSGMRLEVDVSLISALKTSVSNVTRVVEEAGLELEENGLVLGSYCKGLSCLTPDMMELGSTLIDIGFDTTNIAVFKHGSLISSFMLPVGSYNITYDIAICFGIPPMEAERIKLSHGVAMMDMVTEDEELSVNSISSVNQAIVLKSSLAEVIESRLADMFEKIKAEIDKLTKRGIPLGAVLLTGGAAAIDGIAKLAENIFEYPVKIGMPIKPERIPNEVQDPAYALALGLIIYGSEKKSRVLEKPPSSSKAGDIFNRILQWLHEIF